MKFQFLCKTHCYNKNLRKIITGIHFSGRFPACFRFEKSDHRIFIDNNIEDKEIASLLYLNDDEYEENDKKVEQKHADTSFVQRSKDAYLKLKEKYTLVPLDSEIRNIAIIDSKKLVKIYDFMRYMLNMEFFFHLLSKIGVYGICKHGDFECFQRIMEMINDRVLKEQIHFENFRMLTKDLYICNELGDSIWEVDYGHTYDHNSPVGFLFPMFFIDGEGMNEWIFDLENNDFDLKCLNYIHEIKHNPWFIKKEDHRKLRNRENSLAIRKSEEEILKRALRYVWREKLYSENDINQTINSVSKEKLAIKLILNILPLEIHNELLTIMKNY